ncbi:MAG TPA: DUF4432 family protein [Acidobacteriota bacterium]|nr:DUF4432 family protein [Acidobacteriota bacterium]
MSDLYTHNRNWGARLREFQYNGYRMISLENRLLRIVVAVDKGTDIVEFLYKPLDIDFMWHSFVGLRGFTNAVLSKANPAGDFLDYYPGGWQELFPSAGDDCVYRGAPLGIHGEVCLLPWSYRIEKDDPEEISVTFSVRTLRTPFSLQKRLTLGADSGVLIIEEEVKNESGETVDFMWGHHPAFGAPFLDESCRIFLPACTIVTPDEYTSPSSRLEKRQRSPWPFVKGRDGSVIDLSRIPGTEAASHDMAYMEELSEGWYAIISARQGVGFGLAWDPSLFSCVWFWQLYRGGIGYPWYRSNYVAALEPVSSRLSPLDKAIEAGAQLRLEPGAERKTRLIAVAFAKQSEVIGIDPQTGKVF